MRSSQDFDDEIRAHIELETDRLIAEGVPPAEAAARARRTFGNETAVRERFNESQRWYWLSQLVRDFRFALRSMRNHPISAMAVVGTFALGIGATSAIVSVIDTVLLRPAPYPNGERLIAVAETRPVGAPGTTVASIKLEEWNRASKTIQGAAGYYTESQSDTTGALPETVIENWRGDAV